MASFRKSKAGQKFIQQKDAAKKASSSTPTAAATLATSAAAAKPTATSSTTPAATTAAKPTSTSTATPAAKPKPTTSTTPAAKPTKIQQDVADLRRMQAASMMRQQNRNLPSGKIPTGDDLKPSTSTSAPSTQTSTAKPTPTAPVNKARGSSKPGSIVSGFDLFDVVKGYLLGEGYADTEEAALVIMANMSEEWRDSIIEMNDFAAGGGAAKMKATGMTKDQVMALGKKNLASKPASSSSGKSTGSTPSDAVRDRLASTEKYRQGIFKIPSKAERTKSAQDQEAKFDAYQKKQRESGYYKTGYKDLPGTFEKG